ASRYRPRIDNGELVSTEALQIRQLFAVLYKKPFPDDKQPDDRQEEEADTPIEELLLLEEKPAEAENEA
ncbi:MAG: hypothetical protein HOK91_15335, partial [Gammaproteobacteria bacterium]|nr:hypothetical protein [Gammaproteobacteria bacterium]